MKLYTVKSWLSVEVPVEIWKVFPHIKQFHWIKREWKKKSQQRRFRQMWMDDARKSRIFASFMQDSRVMWAVLRTELINCHSKKEYFTFVFADLISWRQCLIYRMLACIALHWSSQCHHSYWHMRVFVILKMHFQGQNNFNSIRSLVTVLLSF